jgi:endonuclease/exonuclease/phosphatase family metal-dependent hydrolase
MRASGPEAAQQRLQHAPGLGTGRSDHILIRGEVPIQRVVRITDHEGGRYPSDHFPVIAEIGERRQGKPASA